MSIIQQPYTWYHHFKSVVRRITESWDATGPHTLRNGVNPVITADPIGDAPTDDGDIRMMLERHDDEFQPRLSQRDGFSGSFDHPESTRGGFDGYMASLRHHGIICIRMLIDGRLASIALLSAHADGVGLYVPLMLTDADYRGLGAMSFMYDIIERVADAMHCTVRLRTSSSYASQNRLLTARHWRLIDVKEHDRAPGVHTTYHEYGRNDGSNDER